MILILLKVLLGGSSAPTTQGYPLCCPRGGSTPDVWTCGDNCPYGTYNYVPSLMFNNNWRMWWCGGYYGDSIFYSTSSNLDSGWTFPSTPVFGPSGVPNSFDEQGSCDPSVIYGPDGNLWLYYGGIGRRHQSDGYFETAVGVAYSRDNGNSWARMNWGNPIITTAGNNRGNLYGAGQPSAVFHQDNYIYLIYTDTGGYDPSGIADCIYMARSYDPSFATGIEYWQGLGKGFLASGKSSHALCCPCESGDLLFWKEQNVWVLTAPKDTLAAGYYVMVLDETFSYLLYEDVITMDNRIDGPGVAKNYRGWGVPDSSGSLRLDLFRGVGDRANIASWKLAHMGASMLHP